MVSIESFKPGSFGQSSTFFGDGDKKAVEAAKLREKMNNLNVSTNKMREQTGFISADQTLMHHTAQRIEQNLKDMGSAVKTTQKPSTSNDSVAVNGENTPPNPQLLASAQKAVSVHQQRFPVVQNNPSNGIELHDIQMTDKRTQILDLVKKLEKAKAQEPNQATLQGNKVDEKNEWTILKTALTILSSAAMKILECSLIIITSIGKLIASLHGELKKWVFSSEYASKMGMFLNPAWVIVLSIAALTAIQRGVVALMR